MPDTHAIARTLQDYLGEELDVLSIGLNPSPASVRDGFYFANPRNRFWRALNRSRLLREPLAPGQVAMQYLLAEYRIGFTDVVKRPTAGGSELRASDFSAWAPVLLERIERLRPRIAWFHGKVAYQNFRRYTDGLCQRVEWGRQPGRLAGSVVFVTPNTSPANAAYSLDDIVDWFDRLADLRDRCNSWPG